MLPLLLKAHKLLTSIVIGWILLVPILNQTLSYRVESNYIDYIMTQKSASSQMIYFDQLPKTAQLAIIDYSEKIKAPTFRSSIKGLANYLLVTPLLFKLWLITSVFLQFSYYRSESRVKLMVLITTLLAWNLFFSSMTDSYIFSRHTLFDKGETFRKMSDSQLQAVYSNYFDNQASEDLGAYRYLWITENFLHDHIYHPPKAQTRWAPGLLLYSLISWHALLMIAAFGEGLVYRNKNDSLVNA